MATPGTSFADLPDVVIGPDGPTVIEAPSQPDPAPPPSAAPIAYPVPVPVPMPQPSQGDQDAEFMRRMAMFNSQKESDENQRRMAEQWERLRAPVELPKDAEELISDPNKLAGVLRDIQERSTRYTTENARMMAQGIAQLQQETEATKLFRAEVAVDRAREILYRQGYQDADSYWNEVEQRLRQDPSKYWQLRTSPQALAMAVKIVRDERIQSGQPVPVAYPQQAPVNPAYQQTGYGSAPTQYNADHVKRAERVLGVRIRPETFRNNG